MSAASKSSPDWMVGLEILNKGTVSGVNVLRSGKTAWSKRQLKQKSAILSD